VRSKDDEVLLRLDEIDLVVVICGPPIPIPVGCVEEEEEEEEAMPVLLVEEAV
jgi:hypothetical protein